MRDGFLAVPMDGMELVLWIRRTLVRHGRSWEHARRVTGHTAKATALWWMLQLLFRRQILRIVFQR